MLRLTCSIISLVGVILVALLLVSDEIKRSQGPGVVVFSIKNVTVNNKQSNAYLVTECAHYIRGCRFEKCHDLSVPASTTDSILLTVSAKNNTIARMEFTVRELGKKLGRFSVYELQENITLSMKISWYRCRARHEC